VTSIFIWFFSVRVIATLKLDERIRAACERRAVHRRTATGTSRAEIIALHADSQPSGDRYRCRNYAQHNWAAVIPEQTKPDAHLTPLDA
jgi:hypothetical protein